jgi:hypothetical protein
MKNNTEQMQKREKLITRLIIVISIVIGILVTFLFTGLLDLIY